MGEILDFTYMIPYYDIGLSKLRPIIPVVFEYKGLDFTFPMLVDSGADVTSLPPELAEGLGVDITELPESSGIGAGGRFFYRMLEGVNLIIVENSIELISPIRFNLSMEDSQFGLLGREVVFDSLRIAFRQCRGPHIFLALEDSA